MTYLLLEVAGTHGGRPEYLHGLLDEMADLPIRTGIKFQIFSADGMALPDFPNYPNYQIVQLPLETWGEVIAKAHETKDVWLDLFDLYGVEALEQNLDLIEGVKLQTSVLSNLPLLKALAPLLADKTLMINVAGRSLEAIEEQVAKVQRLVNPGELVLQVGFQHYPTVMSDSGIGKLDMVQRYFGLPVSLADHCAPDSHEAFILPVLAQHEGVDILEKHVMHSSIPAKWDGASSLIAPQVHELIRMLQEHDAALNSKFITANELSYVDKTVQIPILAKDLPEGHVIRPDDLSFRRTRKAGLSLERLQEHLSRGMVLARDLQAGETIQLKDLRPAKIGALIACRLKSSRLPKKALEKVGEYTTVEHSQRVVANLERVDKVILATSDLESDADLAHYVWPGVEFFAGHPEDVARRFLDAAEAHQLDVIVRLTGDNQFYFSDTLNPLLAAHFTNGNDFTRPRETVSGTNMEVINVAALRKLMDLFDGETPHSEYMTYYFINNPQHFQVEYVQLNPAFTSDIRLTLDYPEDLKLIRAMHEARQGQPFHSLADVVAFLDKNPELLEINAHLTPVFVTDESLVKKLKEVTTLPQAAV